MKNNILIVDDDSSIRILVRVTLDGAGYEVVEASNVKDAISTLLEKEISLVLCDVNMPQQNGYDLVRTLRTDEKLSEKKDIPVVMLTVNFKDSDKSQGKKAGASAWVVKPFQPDLLISTIEKLL